MSPEVGNSQGLRALLGRCLSGLRGVPQSWTTLPLVSGTRHVLYGITVFRNPPRLLVRASLIFLSWPHGSGVWRLASGISQSDTFQVCASYCSTIEGAIYAGVENRIE